MNRRHVVVLTKVCLGVLCAVPALAHHSYAAYDQRITNTVTGTLKEFDWNAPHSGMTIVYTDNDGKAQEVFVTTGAPITLSRQGFKLSDFRVGSKVTLSWHPNRNGVLGGEMAELKLEDGRVLHGGLGPGAAGKNESSPAASVPSPPK